MDSPAPTRILLYAVNGRGLGHLTRLVAIARWLRRIGPLVGGVELCFVTTSEADNVLWLEGFTSFKLPSKSGLDAFAPDRRTIVAMARQLLPVWMGAFRPDLLVVDTFARGAYGELPACLDLARRRALVLRQTRAMSPDSVAAMSSYDRVLLTEHAAPPEGSAPGAVDRSLSFGHVLVREPAELWSREDARRALGIPLDARAVLVTAGGGGDAEAQATLDATATLLRDRTSHHVVVGAGPLSRTRPVRSERIVWLEDGRLPDLVRAFDVAVCAGGANTLAELWQAGVPTVVRPLLREHDDQRARAQRAVEAGAGAMLGPSATPDDVVAAVESLLAVPDASARVRALAPTNDARRAAVALLELARGDALGDVWSALPPDAELLSGEGAVLAQHASTVAQYFAPARPIAVFPAALDAVRALRDEGVPPSTAVRLADLMSRRLLRGTAAERLAATLAVGRALAPLSDWPGAFALVRALGAERDLLPGELASQLADVVARSRSQGLDALALLDLLLSTHALDGAAPENASALSAVRRHLEPGAHAGHE